MDRWKRRRIYQTALGAVLALLGVTVWAIAATLRPIPDDGHDVSISHFEERSLGVITGGASVAGAIILFVTAF